MKWLAVLKLKYGSNNVKRKVLSEVGSPGHNWASDAVYQLIFHSETLRLEAIKTLGKMQDYPKLRNFTNSPLYDHNREVQEETLNSLVYCVKSNKYYVEELLRRISTMQRVECYEIDPIAAGIVLGRIGTPKIIRELVSLRHYTWSIGAANRGLVEAGKKAKPFLYETIFCSHPMASSVRALTDLADENDIKSLLKIREMEIIDGDSSNCKSVVDSILNSILSKSINKVQNDDLELLAKTDSRSDFVDTAKKEILSRGNYTKS